MIQTVKKRLKVRVPENLYCMISKHANEKHKTINSACIDIFGWFFENHSDTSKTETIRQFELRIPEKLYQLIFQYADGKTSSVNPVCVDIFRLFFESDEGN